MVQSLLGGIRKPRDHKKKKKKKGVKPDILSLTVLEGRGRSVVVVFDTNSSSSSKSQWEPLSYVDGQRIKPI